VCERERERERERDFRERIQLWEAYHGCGEESSVSDIQFEGEVRLGNEARLRMA
jgi:hypothetical protein